MPAAAAAPAAGAIMLFCFFLVSSLSYAAAACGARRVCLACVKACRAAFWHVTDSRGGSQRKDRLIFVGSLLLLVSYRR